jgi:peptide deformylase
MSDELDGGREEVERTRLDELEPEALERREAALAQVRTYGDPVLRARALEVERFDDALRAEVERMGALMQDALGVGLAATQLGRLSRVLVYKAYIDEPVIALVNPVIEWSSSEREASPEGCLSIPGVQVDVERPVEVRVRASDPDGKPLEFQAEGLEARVIQHEVDHLDGVLILDRIPRGVRRDVMRAIREGVGYPPEPSRSDGADGDTGPEGASAEEPNPSFAQ